MPLITLPSLNVDLDPGGYLQDLGAILMSWGLWLVPSESPWKVIEIHQFKLESSWKIAEIWCFPFLNSDLHLTRGKHPGCETGEGWT